VRVREGVQCRARREEVEEVTLGEEAGVSVVGRERTSRSG
jgi:hypothetical protein